MRDDNALNASDVAGILHISRASVYEMAKEHKIPSYRVGRKLFFTLKDVQEYRERAKVGKASPAEAGETAPGAARQPALSDSPEYLIAGQGIAADAFVDRFEQLGLNVGRRLRTSYAGLVDLYNGRLDAALVHLYDQRTNSYNVPFVQRLAPGTPIVVFRLLKRRQGFAVAPGNPKGIASWGALLRDGVRVANRTKGCGSRVLMDEKLISMEANVGDILGYETEYDTGLAAAEAVARGYADVAVIGEQIAAHANGIDFVPLQFEWLDIAVAKTGKGRTLVRTLKGLFDDRAFTEEYGRVVHGETSGFGSIVYEC